MWSKKHRRARLLERLARERGALVRYVFGLSGDDALANDVVQEALIRLWHAEDVVTETHARRWLYRTARNGTETVSIVLPSETDQAPEPEPKPEKKPRTKRRPRGDGLGKLVVEAKPWVKCAVGGFGPKTTRFVTELKAGTWEVRCSKSGQQKRRTVRVRPNWTTRVTFDFRK